MSLPLVEDFLSIVLEERPLLDVRAPVEFSKGSFPDATNIAIMDDEQRRLVGICYKEHGHDSAVELGRKLVNEEAQAERLEKWTNFIKENPEAYIYCFRGGQRSLISQTWLDEVGIEIPRLKGGYKAFRAFLTQEAEKISAEISTVIIGGRTGSGKTILLQELDNMIDLEGLAHHRGSSFGRFISSQPSQIDFEDALYYKLIQHFHKKHKHLIIEHESFRVGDVYIPKPVYDNFLQGGIVILVTPIDERVDITYDEYVTYALIEYEKTYGLEAKEEWSKNVLASLKRIRNRLGSQAHLELEALFLEANETDMQDHKIWIKRLLVEYYDPMYDYQIEKSSLTVLFTGNKTEVLDFISKY